MSLGRTSKSHFRPVIDQLAYLEGMFLTCNLLSRYAPGGLQWFSSSFEARRELSL